jgi:hypothetical protein
MEAYFEALSKDKKNIGDNLGCILSSGPGQLVLMQIPFTDKLKKIITLYFEQKVFIPLVSPQLIRMLHE